MCYCCRSIREKRKSDVFSLCSKKGAKQFIRAGVDTSSDVILELLGHRSVSMIQNRTLKKATLQRDKEFQTSIEKLHTFIGLCIICGVIKGRGEPLRSFWNSNNGRSIFRETIARNKFVDLLLYIRLMTNAREQEDEKMTNMPLLETCGNLGNSNEQPSKKFSLWRSHN